MKCNECNRWHKSRADKERSHDIARRLADKARIKFGLEDRMIRINTKCYNILDIVLKEKRV